MKPHDFLTRYNLLVVLAKLGGSKAFFYAEVFKRRNKGIMLNDKGLAVGLKVTLDRYGRQV